MSFEYDKTKSQSNLGKHGIDFVVAQQLWQDERRVELDSSYPGEDRHLVIGQVGGVLYTAITTLRGDSVRIISVRRARVMERRIYEADHS